MADMDDWFTKLLGAPNPTPTPRGLRWFRYVAGLGTAALAGYAGWLLRDFAPAYLSFWSVAAFAIYMTWRSQYLP
jgi:hypothetical protein